MAKINAGDVTMSTYKTPKQPIKIKDFCCHQHVTMIAVHLTSVDLFDSCSCWFHPADEMIVHVFFSAGDHSPKSAFSWGNKRKMSCGSTP